MRMHAITGVLCTCPTTALEMILDFNTLYIVVKMTAKMSILGLMSLRLGKNRVISAQNRVSLERRY